MEVNLVSRPTDWVIIISLLGAFLLVWIRSFDSKRIALFFNFPWKASAGDFALEFNSDYLNYRADRFLLILAWLLSPLLILALRLPFDSDFLQFYSWADYLRVLILAGLFILFKLFMASAIGFVFQVQEELVQGQNLSLAYISWIAVWGAFLSLMVYFTVFSITSAYILWVIVAGGLLLSLFRAILFSFSLNLESSYIILYLCALEIIPLLYLFAFS